MRFMSLARSAALAQSWTGRVLGHGAYLLLRLCKADRVELHARSQLSVIWEMQWLATRTLYSSPSSAKAMEALIPFGVRVV